MRGAGDGGALGADLGAGVIRGAGAGVGEDGADGDLPDPGVG